LTIDIIGRGEAVHFAYRCHRSAPNANGFSVAEAPGEYHSSFYGKQSDSPPFYLVAWGPVRFASTPRAATPRVGSTQAVAALTHFLELSSKNATMRSGPPDPPRIFIGKATIQAPRDGMRSSPVRFSKAGVFDAINIRWAMKSCEGP